MSERPCEWDSDETNGTSGEAAPSTGELRRQQRTQRKGEAMERVAIVARLKEGSGPRAAQLISAGPPFELPETGIARHSVYLSAGEVVFVFEGHQVEWMVDDLINDPFRPEVQSAFDEWRAIVDGSPRIARERFGWEHAEAELLATEAIAGRGR
jgi:hypothetical protein